MDFLQSLCISMGENACYFFCLLDVAKKYNQEHNIDSHIDYFKEVQFAIENRYVKFNYTNYLDKGNFYITNPCAILKHLTGRNWTIEKTYPPYEIKSDEYAIEFWSRTNGESGHFARINDNYNSLQYSRSVKEGKIHSYRIFREVK